MTLTLGSYTRVARSSARGQHLVENRQLGFGTNFCPTLQPSHRAKRGCTIYGWMLHDLDQLMGVDIFRFVLRIWIYGPSKMVDFWTFVFFLHFVRSISFVVVILELSSLYQMIGNKILYI
jgi:hypothetical protein